jgi:hypothetical protein
MESTGRTSPAVPRARKTHTMELGYGARQTRSVPPQQAFPVSSGISSQSFTQVFFI